MKQFSSLPKPLRKNESLLRVAERHDVLDRVYSVAYAERLQYQS